MKIKENCLAQLRFSGYYVEELKYNRKDEVDDKNGKITLSPDFDVVVVTDPEDFHQANVFISVEFKDEDNGYLPFYLYAGIRGFFEIVGDMDEPACNDMYEVNATAILFPYLRAIVTNLSSGNDHPPIVLPAINIKKYMEHKKSKIEKRDV